MRALEHQIVDKEDGRLELNDLPIRAGDRVKVILLVPESTSNGHSVLQKLYPLRGSQPYEFADPFSPIAPEDWESGK